MSILTGKKILITGLLSKLSIAYGVATACKEQGAELIFTYQNDKFKQRVADIAKDFSDYPVIKCDVSEDEDIVNLFVELSKIWNNIDGILHSIAFVPRNGLSGNAVDNIDRETYRIANDISAYSFMALAKHAKSMMQNGGSLVTLSYIGGQKVVPNYNMAGISKAALEATTKYMAYYLGENNIRVNAISAGPIKTLAASGINDFNKMLQHAANSSPLKRNVTPIEVGNIAAFLLSDLSSAITGDIIYADNGFNIMSCAPHAI
jgi:enoyl-[acyl-carrier protein] reductase I